MSYWNFICYTETPSINNFKSVVSLMTLIFLQNQSELSTPNCKYHCNHLVKFLRRYANKNYNRQTNRQMGNNLQQFSDSQMLLKTTYAKHVQVSEQTQ